MKENSLIRISNIIDKTRLSSLMNLWRRNFLRVIVIHYVREKNLDNFKTIIDYMNSNFRIITPNDFLSFYENKNKIKGKNILLTFDDGLYSSYVAVKKVLDPLGLKSIFFVPTKIFELSTLEEMYGFAKTKIYSSMINPDDTDLYKTISAGDANVLACNGHFICSHTHNHVNLRDIKNGDDILAELELSKKVIERITGFKNSIFSYPKGNYKVTTAYSYNAVMNNFAYCFTGIGGKNTSGTNKYYLKRDCIHSYYDVDYAKQILKGVFDIPNYIKYKKLIKITKS